MAATATITVSGSITGLTVGSITVSGQITSAAAVGELLVQALTSGNNSITVPSGSVAVIITPPSASAVTLTLKGVNGDTGVIIAPSGSVSFPATIPLGAAQTTIVINASAPVTVSILFV
jgi:hypothetical protein